MLDADRSVIGAPDENLRVGEALRRGANFLAKSQSASLDARVLLKHALNIDDAGLIARSNEVLPRDASANYADYLQRRGQGEPVAYITGVKEFWSLEFHVAPGVLIPREDSECLIEAIVARRDKNQKLRIVDLGTGSGCLLCALLSEFPNASGVGVDRSPIAVATAHANIERLGLSARASVAAGDWFAPLEGAFDIIVANPPYIPDGDLPGLPRDVGAFEPHEALFAGADGLDAYRVILADAPSRLAPEGLLVMECGAGQAKSLLAMLAATEPLSSLFTIKDIAGRSRGVGVDRRKAEKKD